MKKSAWIKELETRRRKAGRCDVVLGNLGDFLEYWNIPKKTFDKLSTKRQAALLVRHLTSLKQEEFDTLPLRSKQVFGGRRWTCFSQKRGYVDK